MKLQIMKWVFENIICDLGREIWRTWIANLSCWMALVTEHNLIQVRNMRSVRRSLNTLCISLNMVTGLD